MNAHLEDFAILLYVTNDLSLGEYSTAAEHLLRCEECGATLARLEKLDIALKELAASGAMDDFSSKHLAENDPFHRRPEPARQPAATLPRLSSAISAIRASALGQDLVPDILKSAREPEAIASLLSTLDPGLSEHRFAVLYALQEAGRTSAEDPFRAMAFARSALGWIHTVCERKEAETVVPRMALRGQAHLLLGIANLWTTRYPRARAHLMAAYRGFAKGGGDETKLAFVELAEAQRRALSHEPTSAIVLARRARNTFSDRGQEDYTARAWVAEGLALYSLNRDEDAIQAYREALPAFERGHLWSNYVGALNSVATSLTRLGRYEEARREYARALRRFSQEEHRYWLGYLRIGFAEALLAAGRYREAATAAGRAAKIFGDCRLRAQSLIAMLFEVESWARHRDVARAQHRLRLFWVEVERDGKLDEAILKDLAGLLSGANPNVDKLASLRELAAKQLQERYRVG